MAAPKTIKFSDIAKFQPKQMEATRAADTHKFTLFGGSRGPGKSYWLRYYLLRQLFIYASKGFNNVRVMMACEDYPSLYERQTTKVLAEFPDWLGTMHIKQNEYRLRPEFGGGIIAFRNLDDPRKYQSAEFATIAVDELPKNPERTFHMLRGSLRWPGIEDTKFIAASNPDPGWVRRYWIEKRLPPELEPLRDEFIFVPALPQDNQFLPESYWRDLETLPPRLRDAWLHGDWYAGTEGLVFENFNSENIVPDEPDPDEPWYLAIDDGYIDPRATLFIQRKPNGDILVFDELYERRTLEEETIAHVFQKMAQHGLERPVEAIVSHEAQALIDRLLDEGIQASSWLSQRAGSNQSTRMQAIQVTQSFILDGRGHRGLLVHPRCTNLLDEIMAGYRYQGEGEIAKPEKGHDHACDALTGFIWYYVNGPTDIEISTVPKEIADYAGQIT